VVELSEINLSHFFLFVKRFSYSTGTTWVNKNFQTGVDPTLTYAGMSTLGTHLKHMPAGWKFRSEILTQDIVFKANGS
jgi:hypothetical protein